MYNNPKKLFFIIIGMLFYSIMTFIITALFSINTSDIKAIVSIVLIGLDLIVLPILLIISVINFLRYILAKEKDNSFILYIVNPMVAGILMVAFYALYLMLLVGIFAIIAPLT